MTDNYDKNRTRTIDAIVRLLAPGWDAESKHAGMQDGVVAYLTEDVAGAIAHDNFRLRADGLPEMTEEQSQEEGPDGYAPAVPLDQPRLLLEWYLELLNDRIEGLTAHAEGVSAVLDAIESTPEIPDAGRR